MLTYIVRRLLWMIVLLLVISFLTFLIFSKLPSADPVSLRAGRNATPELRASIRHTFGLDKPFFEQYRIYLAKLVPFDVHSGFKPPDFGYSYQNNVSVKSQILDRLPATAGLALGGVVVWLLIGIPIGIISAIRRGRIEDRIAMGGALVAISAPVYWLVLGGAILTESVFNIPGIGRLAYDSIQKSDLPTVQGTVIIGAFFIIFLNLIVDIVYAFLDPRVRY